MVCAEGFFFSSLVAINSGSLFDSLLGYHLVSAKAKPWFDPEVAYEILFPRIDGRTFSGCHVMSYFHRTKSTYM